MNNKINQLIEQATTKSTTYFDGRGNVTETYFDKEKFAELLIREYSYDVMNVHGAKPEYIQFAARCWGVEV